MEPNRVLNRIYPSIYSCNVRKLLPLQTHLERTLSEFHKSFLNKEGNRLQNRTNLFLFSFLFFYFLFPPFFMFLVAYFIFFIFFYLSFFQSKEFVAKSTGMTTKTLRQKCREKNPLNNNKIGQKMKDLFLLTVNNF